MNRFYVLLCALLCVTALQAQQIKVSGIVKSGEEPLIGVTVADKSRPTHGTMTDFDGKFEITVDANATLVFKYLGYNTQEEQVKERKVINLNMSESDIALDDVVITVPYGTAKKSTFTGSAGLVDGTVIAKAQVSNITRALQGTMAGVQSFSMSGQPGEDATIRIRGVGSINASSAPLYVVDGVPYEGSLSSISSSDIASVTVMKDAASATLYGSRAANGVIMITTKQGNKDSKPEVEFSAKYGFSDRARKDYKQMNTNQYFELYWEAIRNENYDKEIASGKTPAAAMQLANQHASNYLVPELGNFNPYGKSNTQPVGLDGKLKDGMKPLWNDSWDDALTQNANFTDVNLRISGGSATSKYYFSAGYLSDQGYVKESGFERFNVRANITTDVKKWLQVGLNVSGTHSKQDYPKQDDSAISNVILFARSIPSFYPVYKRDPETGAYVTSDDDLLNKSGNKAYDFGNYRPTSYAGHNLAGTLPLDKSERKRDAASVRGYIQVEPLKDLFFRSSINVDYESRFNHDYSNSEWGKSVLQNEGSASRSYNRRTSITLNNVINYTKDINKDHNIHVLAGQEYYTFKSVISGGTKSRMPMLGMDEPSVGARLDDFYGYSNTRKMLSFFGSAEYSFLKRYYLSASVRADGSSKFASSHRWGTFWSLGASWRIVDESFMSDIKDKWLSNLLLRTSYGAQGNDNISDNQYQGIFDVHNNLGKPGFVASRLENKKLSWETNYNLNIGLDFGFFNNRLSGSVEFFERRSKDLLFPKALAPSTGYASILENVGSLKNYGWEILVEGYPIHTKDWKWKLSANATMYKNKITKLPSDVMWNGQKKWVKGGSVYDFYLTEWAGINQANGKPQWYYYDETTGDKLVTENYARITDNDKVKVGNSLPDVSGGFSTTLAFKDIELSALFSYNIGGKIYNRDKLSLLSHGSAGSTWSKDMLNRWTPENPNTDIPRLTTSPESSWTSESNRHLVSRSFLKLKNVTLSYSLPQKWVKAASLKTVNVFVQAENLFTITKQQGLDPEQTFDGTTYYRYPTMRTISFGLTVKL